MTVGFLALYETPADPEAFERHYREIHIPLGCRLPGLRRYAVGRDVTAVRGAPYYLIAELEWDTMDELRAAFASPEGRAAAADAARLQEFTSVRSMIFTVDDSVMHAELHVVVAEATPPNRHTQPQPGPLELPNESARIG